MAAQTTEGPLPNCAISSQPVFDLNQERVATKIVLISLEQMSGEQTAPSLADTFRHLQQSGIEHLHGSEPVILQLPACEAKTLLDLPWSKERIIAYLDTTSSTDANITELHNKVWDKEYRFVLDTPSRQHLPLDKPQPQLLVTSIKNRVAHNSDDKLAPIPLWLTDVDSREAADSIMLGREAEWISGSFWKQPNIQPGRAIPASRLGALKLLAELQNPNINIEEIENIINCDATLSYKLLKLLNSAFFSSPGRVDSIRSGVNFFGLQRIKNWATVIVMNSVDFKPRDILPLGAYRARLAETLANAMGHDHPPDYYLVGLFSVLDAMFDSPLEELIAPLHLQSEVYEALSNASGPMGELLSWLRATEQGERYSASTLENLATVDVLQIQIDALHWTNEFCHSIRS